MKLRCVPNSIRLRLRKSDIQLLKLTGSLIDSLHFPGQKKLSYGIQLNEQEYGASFDDMKMIIHINSAIANEWMDSQEVSLAIKMPIEKDQSLSILIEKDFPCKHTGDDFDDTFHELQPEAFKMIK